MLYKSSNEDKSHNRKIADKERSFNFVRSLLEGAQTQWCMDNYMEAQSIIESINQYTVNEQL